MDRMKPKHVLDNLKTVKITQNIWKENFEEEEEETLSSQNHESITK